MYIWEICFHIALGQCGPVLFVSMTNIYIYIFLSADPTIQYKEEMDFNHNEAFTSFSKVEQSSMYNNHNHENAYVSKKDDIELVYNETPSDQTDAHYREEDLQTPQCQNIPLTVTSPDDDDNDSGTESSSSVISNKSNNIQNNRKRPGRKKGQGKTNVHPIVTRLMEFKHFFQISICLLLRHVRVEN